MTATKSPDAFENLLGRHWHHLPASEVIQLLETNSESGLDRFALNHRQTEFGPNQLTPRKGRRPWMRLLLLQAGLTYLPLLNTIFQTAPVGWGEWLRILGAGLTAALLVESQKWLVTRKERRP
jgi:Ca2+-transporting ATPase